MTDRHDPYDDQRPTPIAREPDTYEPPGVVLLGTLTDITRGGDVGPDDGFGGAGAVGSL